MKRPGVNAANQKAHRQRIILFVRKLKEGKPCTDCGVLYPYYIMDFDHVHGRKEFGLSRTSAVMKSYASILKEAAKCEIVCSNCHRARTYLRREAHRCEVAQ